MKLKRQLMAASLFMLALPWAGCQYVRETESALRMGQLQALEATGKAVVALLGQQNWGLEVAHHSSTEDDPKTAKAELSIFAPEQNWRIVMDGYLDEWLTLPPRRLENGNFAANLRTFSRHGKLYMHLEVEDSERRYYDPMGENATNGDHLVIRAANGRDYFLAASAPGEMIARYQLGSRTLFEREIAGYWLETSQGYNVELSLPLHLIGKRLGIYLVNASAITSQQQYLSHFDFSNSPLPPVLVTTLTPLTNILKLFAQPGLQMTVIDNHYWQRASAGELVETSFKPTTEVSHGALRALYRAILKQPPSPPPNKAMLFGQRHTSDITQAQQGIATRGWYHQNGGNDRSLLSVALPIPSKAGGQAGVLLLEQGSESYLSLTDKAFGQLLLASSISLLFGASGLLGYASWLSWRIRRLNNATRQAFDDNGAFHNNFNISKANDEIGDLSRSYAELLERVHQYTHYLQTLSRKLSHELRTPLAIVHSSLDNLAMTDKPADQQMYLQRAKEGASRLSYLLTAMSEASRLEESIHQGQAELEKIDLCAMLTELTAAYNDIYLEHKILFNQPVNPVWVRVAPELIVQMLDKLLDNATGFAPPQSEIHLILSSSEKSILIAIENKGPLLPTTMQHQLFDNMVSVRDTQAIKQGTHLGLGLHIVRLISEYHQGSVKAENLPDKSGVRFTIQLPNPSLSS